MQYEWAFGAIPVNGAQVDQDLAQQVADAFAGYVAHVGRMEGLPAFDAFDLSAAENSSRPTCF